MRGPLAHAASSSGYNGEAHFIECVCGLRITAPVPNNAPYEDHLKGIDATYVQFKWHRGV